MLNLSLEEVKQYEKEYTAVPVCKEIFADMTTPIRILNTIIKERGSDYFLLESIEGGEKWGRYSFIGCDPVLRLKTKDNVVELENIITLKVDSHNPIEHIRKALSEYKVPKLQGLPPFTGGFVGYFAYDFIQYCEPKLKFSANKATPFADIDLLLFDKVIAFDHLKQKIFIIVNVKTDNLALNYHKAEEEVEKIEAMINKNMPQLVSESIKLGQIQSNQTKLEYRHNVEKVKNFIKQGDAFQIVYSQRFSAEYSASLFNFYRVLRRSNPSQYMFLFKNKDVEIAGSSPETLVKIKGEQITVMPIAGTRKRGGDETEDARLEKELLADAKEIAEHNMLVDLARNDVGKVSEFGTVKVSEYQKIKKFSHVMHITTQVTGTLKPGKDSLDVLCAAFPAGTLSGAPKVRACEIIDALEPTRRGIYGGGIGYIDFAGNLDLCITIRTAVKAQDKVYIQAGGGIVADSEIENEYQETINKSGAVMDALLQTTEANNLR